MKRVLIFACLLLVACVAEIELHEPFCGGSGDEVEVLLDISGGEHVRSSLDLDEYEVAELAVVVYRNGIQEYIDYFPSLQPILSLKLIEGQSYNIYVTANMGVLPSCLDEDEFKADFRYTVSSILDMKDNLPMVWNCMNLEVYEGMGEVEVNLERLAAKITFSLDKSLLGGLTVASVRLCQCAGVVRPFKQNGGVGSCAEGPYEIIDGDMASQDDLIQVNQGKSVTFYALENCQGVLLPNNESSAAKLPDALGEKAGLCTYLEVSGFFGEEAFLDGTVTYRFYLGLDACSSFDVPGNACIDVGLQLTGMGLHEVSWRVDADVSVREGYAWGTVAQGLHDMNELYVGERILYRVEVSDEILSYVGGNLSRCFLQLDAVPEALEFSSLQGEGKIYTCEITCRSTVRSKLYLCGPDGERLATLCSNVGVRNPIMVFSEFPDTEVEQTVEALSYLPQCVINGPQQEVYLYLTDTKGRNLNSSSAYGFDVGSFGFNMRGIDGETVLDKAFTASFATGTECSDGYAAMMRLWCFNDGKDVALGSALSETYSSGGALNVVVNDAARNLTGMCKVGLGIFPITLTLVDNGWAGHHSTQLSMSVHNQSNMPLEILTYQMVDNNKAWTSSSLTTEIGSYVTQNLVRKFINYITGSVCTHDQKVYLSGAQVTCSGSGVFPLDGIETDDIMKSLIYDKLGNDRMYHVVDVTAGGCSIFKSDVTLVDALSDGSSLYDTIYLSDWDSKGVWLFSNDEPIYSPGNYMMHFPNLSPLRIQRLKQRYDECPNVGLSLWYEDGVYRGYSPYSQGLVYGLKMTLRWHGTVQGYVQTDPKGIWGSVKDNYCSATFDKTLKGVPLAGLADKVSMDGGVVKAAMDAIYAQTFEDKKDGDKFQHSAHPVSMECNVEIYVEGENGEELYPMRVYWEYPYVTYYHAQDGVSYSCQMTQNVPRFNMVHVAKK